MSKNVLGRVRLPKRYKNALKLKFTKRIKIYEKIRHEKNGCDKIYA